MGMLNLTTGILLFTCATGLYAGLDKLIGTLIFLALLTLSLYYNLFTAWVECDDNRAVVILTGRIRKLSAAMAARLLKIAASLAIVAASFYFFAELYWLSLGQNLTVYDSFNLRVFYLATHLALVFYGVFAVRTLQSQKKSDDSEQWYRALAYFSVYQALIAGLSAFSSYLSEADSDTIARVVDYGLFGVFILVALLNAEILSATVRNIACLTRSQKEPGLPVPFFIRFFAAEDSVRQSLIRSIETISGVDVARSEIVGFSMRILEPVLLITLLAVWLTTSIVIVPPEKEAIFKRFGRISGAASCPAGLYFKLPWPVSSVELYEPHRIRTINIGFEPDPKQRHIIWTKSHAVNYFHLIVGDGVEIIAIDCQLMYRVSNLFKYITSLQNPEEFISATAYKYLTQATVSTKFDEIISRDRKLLAEQLKTNIQGALDRNDLGVQIVEVVFLAMHPPIEVAEAYEDVISAQIDKLTYVLKANTENTHKLFMSKADAGGKVLEAKSYAAGTVSRAVGDAASFVSRTAGFELEPDLARFRLRLDRLQQLLGTKTIYVIDKTLMREKDSLFLNLEN